MREESKQKLSNQDKHLEFAGIIEYRRYNVFSGERYTDENAYLNNLERPSKEINNFEEDMNYEEMLNKEYDFIDDINKIYDEYITIY